MAVSGSGRSFTASKGNHDSAVVSQAKTASGQVRIDWECTGPQSGDGGQPGVGGFEVMLELMGICIELDDDAPLATYPQGSQWKVWKEKEATAALRAVIERQGLDPREYALHSGRIGGCLLYTSPSPRDLSTCRMPSSA